MKVTVKPTDDDREIALADLHIVHVDCGSPIKVKREMVCDQIRLSCTNCCKAIRLPDSDPVILELLRASASGDSRVIDART
jgi:hypothetical protein